jgi:spore coat protein U-like protein
VANASSALDATANLTVTCTQGASTTLTLGQGSNADTGSTDASPLRRLSDGGDEYLNYALYSDSARTSVWNNDTGVSNTGTGSSQAFTVYGRVAAGQNTANAGSYADTVVATVTF